MNLLHRQALPDPPANQQHPSSSQSDALLVSGDVKTNPIPFPRHYVTPLKGHDSSGYKVPARDSDGYDVPVRDSDGYEDPARDSDGYKDVIRESDGYEVPVYDSQCANQEPVYSQIQDVEDNYDDTEVL